MDTFGKTTVRVNKMQSEMVLKAIAEVDTEGMNLYDVTCLNGIAYEFRAALEDLKEAASKEVVQ